MVAYDYLNCSDRILFCDPLPDLDDDWLLYPGLDRDTISEIADYMSTETPDLFGILTYRYSRRITIKEHKNS